MPTPSVWILAAYLFTRPSPDGVRVLYLAFVDRATCEASLAAVQAQAQAAGFPAVAECFERALPGTWALCVYEQPQDAAGTRSWELSAPTAEARGT